MSKVACSILCSFVICVILSEVQSQTFVVRSNQPQVRAISRNNANRMFTNRVSFGRGNPIVIVQRQPQRNSFFDPILSDLLFDNYYMDPRYSFLDSDTFVNTRLGRDYLRHKLLDEIDFSSPI